MVSQSVQDELRMRFNPDGSDLRKVQLRLLDMLLYIDRICKENCIDYWLSSGTLIGAVRHGGFIPWDDDVDVEMMPDGLRRFIKAVELDKTGQYAVHNHSNDPNYLFAFTKLRDLHTRIEEEKVVPQKLRYEGCSIDIFTMVPSNSRKLHVFARKCIGKEMTLWRAIAGKTERQQSLLKGIIDFPIRRIALPLLTMLSRINAGSRLRHTLSAPFHAPRRREDIFPLSKVMFEGHEFPAPGNTDAYLRLIYGDYTKIPPVDKIHVHAKKIEIYDTDV